MPRPTIHCPQCQRELFNLHHPWCPWCGADLPQEEYEKVALPLGELPTTDLPPLQADNAWMQPTYGVAPFGLGVFRRLNPMAVRGSASPWERKLRLAGAVLGVCLVSAKLIEVIWSLWCLHQAMPLAPHLR